MLILFPFLRVYCNGEHVSFPSFVGFQQWSSMQNVSTKWTNREQQFWVFLILYYFWSCTCWDLKLQNLIEGIVFGVDYIIGMRHACWWCSDKSGDVDRRFTCEVVVFFAQTDNGVERIYDCCAWIQRKVSGTLEGFPARPLLRSSQQDE